MFNRLVRVSLFLLTFASTTCAQDVAPWFDSQFDSKGAMRIVRFLSARWRTRGGGNPGFNESVDYVRDYLKNSGFEKAGSLNVLDGSLTLYPFAWNPVSAQVEVLGSPSFVLDSYPQNPTLLTRFSGSTSKQGVVAEVVEIPVGTEESDYESIDVKGKIVFGRGVANRMYQRAVVERGAVGIISDNLARKSFYQDYPDMVRYASLVGGAIKELKARSSWALKISPQTGDRLRAALNSGPLKLRVRVQSQFLQGRQRALVAEIPGTDAAGERVFFVCHMDNNRPGANNNATGVAAHAELARMIALGIKDGSLARPKRTLTFLFGAEHAGTDMWLSTLGSSGRTIAAFNADMTGAKTETTLGIYRFERYPDPSTDSPRKRADRALGDRRSGWGFRSLGATPPPGHYFNALMWFFVENQGRRTNWRVFQNPFEGGSDHDELLERGIPTVLSWYYDDPFLSTNLDTPDKVDPRSIRNVATVHGVTAMAIAGAARKTALWTLALVEEAALKRLKQETDTAQRRLTKAFNLSSEKRRDVWFATWEEEQKLARRWHAWEREAIKSVASIVLGHPVDEITARIENSLGRFDAAARAHLAAIEAFSLKLAPDSSAQAILDLAISYHDPHGHWGTHKFALAIEEGRPDGSSKTTNFVTQASKGRFQIELVRKKRKVKIDILAEHVVATVDGRSDISAQERSEFRLNPKRIQVTRNYYEYLYGLPMKLRDPGTRLHPLSWRQEFNGRSVDAIRTTYDRGVGQDTWHFFFDVTTHAMVGYLFYHDSQKKDGEYIILTGESVAATGLRLPQVRKWYTNLGERFLGADKTIKLEDLGE